MKSFRFKINTLKIRWTVYILIFSVFIISICIANNYYSLEIMREQIYESSMNVIYLYNSQIEMGLQNVDNYLSNLGKEEDTLHMLNKTKNNKDSLLAVYQINQKLVQDISLYKDTDAFFMYDPRQKLYTFASSKTETYDQEYAINDYIKKYIEEIVAGKREYPISWTIEKMGDQYYVVRLMKTGDLYIGSWVQTEHILEKLDAVDIRGIDYIVFADTNHIFTMNPEILSKDISLPEKYDGYGIVQGKSEKYLISGQENHMGNFNLISIINERNFSEKLKGFQIIFIFVIIADGILLILFMWQIMKKIMNPLNELVEAMKNVKDGNLDTKLKVYKHTQEFVLVSEMFNSMMTEIKKLKIEVYEKKLESQKVRLDFYNIQTNPHFFINSMNVIYSFACIKDYNRIKEFVKCIVNHFRYILSNHQMVSIEQELEFAKNYMEMQRIRSLDNYTFELKTNVDQWLKNKKVPSLIIQEFVSNALKHQKSGMSDIEVSVTVSEEEKNRKNYVHIIIEDNGSGFDENVRQALERGEEIIDQKGKHIGIYNIRQRLKYMYGEETEIHFSNKVLSGAKIDIWFLSEDRKEENWVV